MRRNRPTKPLHPFPGVQQPGQITPGLPDGWALRVRVFWGLVLNVTVPSFVSWFSLTAGTLTQYEGLRQGAPRTQALGRCEHLSKRSLIELQKGDA